MSDFYYADKTDAVSELEKRNSEIVRKLAGECAVLFENDGTLPLPNVGKIALFGNGARHTIKGGTGSGDVNSRYVVNIEKGLESNGFTITSKKWLDEFDVHYKKMKEEYQSTIERMAKEQNTSPISITFTYPFVERTSELITEEHVKNIDTDTAVYVLSRNSGEGNDRFYETGDYLLMKDEIQNLIFITQRFKKVILLLNVGGVIDFTQIDAIPGINSILYISQSGNQIGNIVADLLIGKSIPSGKLSTTWARNYNDYPYASQFSHQNGDWHDEWYKEGIYVGYRYFDRLNIEPRFCFGYGSSYTNFEISPQKVDATAEKITVKATVKNIGATFAGKEVVQVYVSAPNGHLDKPFQVLVGFAKTKLLQPGQSEELTIECPWSYCASYCEEHSRWILEEGSYIVRVGNSSRNTSILAKIELDKCAVLEQLKKVIPPANVEEISLKNIIPYRPLNDEEQLKNAPVIKLSSSSFKTKTIEYHDNIKLEDKHKDHKITMQEVIEGKYSIEELVAQLI